MNTSRKTEFSTRTNYSVTDYLEAFLTSSAILATVTAIIYFLCF